MSLVLALCQFTCGLDRGADLADKIAGWQYVQNNVKDCMRNKLKLKISNKILDAFIEGSSSLNAFNDFNVISVTAAYVARKVCMVA